MNILVDATFFRVALTATISDIVARLRSRTPIAVWRIFDSDAFRPVNPTAAAQLDARGPFTTANGTHWVSPGALLPLSLDYRLWQADLPIQIKVAAPGAIEMKCELDEAAKTLDIALVSALKVRVLNTFRQGDRDVRVPEPLDLRSIRITATSITYHLAGSSVNKDLILEAIYDSTHATAALQNAPYRIKWGRVAFLERIKLAFHSAITNDDSGCVGDDVGNSDGPKKWILWHKVQGDMNVCDVSSSPTCVTTHPRDNALKSIGCYGTEEAARAAENAERRCQNDSLIDPFTLAAQTNVAKDDD